MLTYRNGDKEWAAKQFKINTNFAQISCKIVYLSGILYIVSPYRQVALYNIVDEEFKFERLFKDKIFRLNIVTLKIYMYRVFELNRELMMIQEAFMKT